MGNTELFSLGDIYISDFLKEGANPRGPMAPLTLVLEGSSGAVRLTKAPDGDLMYGQYWYRSGINTTMRKELGSIAQSCLESVKTNKGDLWLDIACNDGTLLRQVPDDMIKVGIDPADDSYVNESKQIADLIIQDYFTKSAYLNSKFGDKKAKIVTCIAMFYDLDDPSSFLDDVYEIMDDEGLFVLQMSYTPLMLKQLAFDNICHEHVYYYNLTNIKGLLENSGFRVVDCQVNDVNGGSFRVYVRKESSDVRNFKTSPYRDVANYRIESILNKESIDEMDTPKPYMEFWENINELKEQTVNFIKEEKVKGKTIWGYGASTKGNTLLQWFGLDHTLIDGIAERSPYKFGLKTVGTNIPIYSEDEMRKVKPDYMLVLPWHFIHEFVKREKNYLNGGGKFIVPCPKFEIIGG
jgi:ubiquinone/menaquinone biosynthesis C-methylase UbiE